MKTKSNFFRLLLSALLVTVIFSCKKESSNVLPMTIYTGISDNPSGIAFDGTNMWTANRQDGSVTRITPSGVMTTYTGAGGYPLDIAFDGTNMWTANEGGASVSKITPSGVITTYPLIGQDPNPAGIAFDGTNMWVTSSGLNGVIKITVR